MTTAAKPLSVEVPPLARLPNEWHDTGGVLATCFACWRASWPDELPQEILSRLGKFRQEVLGDTRDTRGARDVSAGALLPAFAGSLALHLQARSSVATADWVARLELPQAQGFKYPFFDSHIATLAGVASHAIVHALIAPRDADHAAWHARATRMVNQAVGKLAAHCATESTLKPVLEALARGIPVARMSPKFPVFRLGTGGMQQRLWRGFTSATSRIAAIMAMEKDVAIQLMLDHGLPVPRHQVVHDAEAATLAARSLGYPVVVKPTNTDMGTAVSTGIMDDAALLTAFTLARKHGPVLVEQHIPGSDHRLTVLDGRCISVTRREPAQVLGNGVDTVQSLMEQLARRRRADPVMGLFRSASLADPLVVQMLAQQGVAPQDVPPAGTVVMLRGNSNLSTGGIAFDMTGATHPDNLRMAERAAACIGLNHAGIDFITTDIGKSWREVGGGICEINPTPALATADAPSHLVDYLFPGGANGQVPIVVVVGEAQDTRQEVDAVAALAKSAGAVAGVVFDGEAHVAGFTVSKGRQSASRLADLVLADPEVDVAVVQVTPAQLEAGGLNAPYCDIACFFTGDDAMQRIVKSPLSVLGQAKQTAVRPLTQDVEGLVEVLLSGAALRALVLRRQGQR